MVEPKCSCGSTKFKEGSKMSKFGYYIVVYCTKCGLIQGTYTVAEKRSWR